ncbi:MAG: DUF4382 domain-containing protein [Burkholderiaceae bacterium]|jgi:hypothetical protein|nr:DUF4382 domain-containing protein [Burkholderiaceae bacterium]
MIRFVRRGSLIAVAAVVAACGGGGGGGGGTGTLGVSLTDAPACGYDNVWVTVTKVRVHKAEGATDGDAGWSEVLVDGGAGRRIDLLSLQNGVLADLGQTSLPEGHYTQVRLVLSEANGANQITLTGNPTPISLDTPSAQQSGLKLKHGFDVAAGEEVDLVLDFDACKSIVKRGGQDRYNLKPVVSVLPILVGSIEGAAVAPAAAATEGAWASLQKVDPATGEVTVVRATTVRDDGTWTLSPVPVSSSTGPEYNLVIGAPGYASVVFTNVPVQTGVPTTVPGVTLDLSTEREIGGAITPVGVNNSVQALQEVATDVVIEADFATADAVTPGEYTMSVPSDAARVAPYAASSPAFVTGSNAGQYRIRATNGTASKEAPADVTGGNVVDLDFAF